MAATTLHAPIILSSSSPISANFPEQHSSSPTRPENDNALRSHHFTKTATMKTGSLAAGVGRPGHSEREALATVDVNISLRRDAEEHVQKQSVSAEVTSEQCAEPTTAAGMKRKRVTKPRAKGAAVPGKKTVKKATEDTAQDDEVVAMTAAKIRGPRARKAAPVKEGKKTAASRKTKKNAQLVQQDSRDIPALETEEISCHFGNSRQNSRSPTLPAQDDLGLERAAPRRREWTPQPENRIDEASPNGDDGDEARVSFSMSLGGFAYAQEFGDVQPVADTTVTKAATRKRKVDGTSTVKAAQVEKPAKKAKAPKAPKPSKPPKIVRPKTVTEYAIAAYKVPEKALSPEPVRQVSDFFRPMATQTVEVRDNSALLDPEKKASKQKKIFTTTVEFKFPPPARARKEMQQQDFLFGTSSQLAVGDSPRTHRMMQQAVQESEGLAFASSQLQSEHLEHSPTTSRLRVAMAPHGTSLTLQPGLSNLWSAAARDDESKMFTGSPRPTWDGFRELSSSPPRPVVNEDLSAVDQIRAPMPVEAVLSQMETDQPRPAVQVADEDDSKHDSGFVDISLSDCTTNEVDQTLQAEHMPIDHRTSKQVKPAKIRLSPVAHVISSSPATAPLSPKFHIRPSAAMASPAKASAHAADPRATKRKTPEPDTTATVAPAKRPRGRPRKKASAPAVAKPVQVEQSAASSGKTTSVKPTALIRTAPAPKAKTTSPTAKRQTKKSAPLLSPVTPKRARKTSGVATAAQSTSQKSWADIDEISDSEPGASTPSPPRRAASDVPAVPIPLQLSPRSDALPDDIVADNGASSTITTDVLDNTKLFATITRVIKSAPRTTDVRHPSWHEKMLLYDPIVLEDLTAWLVEQGVKPDGTVGAHTHQLELVASGTASTSETVATTTAKGKGKVKGKGRAAITAETRAAVLQPFVVQKWCQRNSVCCLWKEGLRGGVRQRY